MAPVRVVEMVLQPADQLGGPFGISIRPLHHFSPPDFAMHLMDGRERHRCGEGGGGNVVVAQARRLQVSVTDQGLCRCAGFVAPWAAFLGTGVEGPRIYQKTLA